MARVQILSLILGTCVVSTTGARAQEPGYLLNLYSQFSSLYAGLFQAPHYGGQPQLLAQAASERSRGNRRMASMPGNRHVLVYEPPWEIPAPAVPFHAFDQDTGIYVPFLTLPPPPPHVGFYLSSFLVDQEGDLIVYGVPSETGSIPGLYRRRSDMTLQRFATLGGSYDMDRVIVDIDTGDYIVSQMPRIWRVRPSGTTSPLASAYHAVGPFQDPGTGEFLLWNGNFPAVLSRVTRAGAVTTTTFPGVDMAAVSVVDESPTGMGEYVVSTLAGIIRFPRQGGPITRLFLLPPSPNPSMPMGNIGDLMMDRIRNLSTANAGAPNRWTLFVSFPFDAMSTYLCLVGVSGIRPGITLPDGKIIRLNPDGVTGMGLAGLLPGFTGLTGTLDSMGRAQGMIDLSWLPPAAVGTPFWIVGLVLDPSPPVIRRVSPAMVIQLR